MLHGHHSASCVVRGTAKALHSLLTGFENIQKVSRGGKPQLFLEMFLVCLCLCEPVSQENLGFEKVMMLPTGSRDIGTVGDEHVWLYALSF